MTVIIWAQASDGVLIASDGHQTRNGQNDEPNVLVNDAVTKVHWRRELSPRGVDSVLTWGSLGRGEVDGEDVNSLIKSHVDADAQHAFRWDTQQMIKVLQDHVHRWNEKEVCTCGAHCPDFLKCDLPDEAEGIGRDDFFNPGGAFSWCPCRAWLEEPLTLITQKFNDGVASPLVVQRVTRTGHIEEIPGVDNVAIYGSLVPESRAQEQTMKLNEGALQSLDELRPQIENILATAYYEAAWFAHFIELPGYTVPSIGGLARFVTLRSSGGHTVVDSEEVPADSVKKWQVWLPSGLGKWEEF